MKFTPLELKERSKRRLPDAMEREMIEIKVKADSYTNAKEKAKKLGFKISGDSYWFHEGIYKFNVVNIGRATHG